MGPVRGASTWRGWAFRSGCTVAAAGMGLVLVAPAFACTPLATISSKPARGAAGTEVSVNGSGFTANGNGIDLKWGGPNGRVLTTATPGETGIFTTSVTVPSDAQLAYYQLSAVQAKPDGGSVTASFAFQVEAAQPPAAPGSALPGGEPAAGPADLGQVDQPVGVAVPPAAGQTPAAPAPPARTSSSQPAPSTASRTPAAVSASPAASGAAPGATSTAVPGAVPGAAGAATAEPAPVAPLAGVPGLEPVPPVYPLVWQDGPRTGLTGETPQSGGGHSPWSSAPLVLGGLTLLAGSAVAVGHGARQKRRVRA